VLGVLQRFALHGRNSRSLTGRQLESSSVRTFEACDLNFPLRRVAARGLTSRVLRRLNARRRSSIRRPSRSSCARTSTISQMRRENSRRDADLSGTRTRSCTSTNRDCASRCRSPTSSASPRRLPPRRRCGPILSSRSPTFRQLNDANILDVFHAATGVRCPHSVAVGPPLATSICSSTPRTRQARRALGRRSGPHAEPSRVSVSSRARAVRRAYLPPDATFGTDGDGYMPESFSHALPRTAACPRQMFLRAAAPGSNSSSLL